MRRTPSAARASQISVWRSHGRLQRGHSIEGTKRSVRFSTIGRWQGIRTYGSGRLVNVTVTGEANQDGQQHK